jgi:hypothetical protein
MTRSEAQGVLVKLNVNGADAEVDDRFETSPLLWVLRDVLGLRGTKYGCGKSSSTHRCHGGAGAKPRRTSPRLLDRIKH